MGTRPSLAIAAIFIKFCFFASGVLGMETPAEHALLIDYRTGTVLLEKHSDAPMAPSSMAKLMTLYLVFEQLREGHLTLDTPFEVSKKAWKMGGSKMFVEVGKNVRVEDLIRGVVVQSGNDACIVIAEGISGSEEKFSRLMNDKASELGMKNSNFVNASGWPDANQYVTASDLAILATGLIRDFPEFYYYFAEKTFTYNGIRQGNRNPLLYKHINADGLKTGHTEAAGFGLVASAVSDNSRLILVVNGLKSVNQRSRESERLLKYGFREFGSYILFKKNEIVDRANVWLGDEDAVPLRIKTSLELVLTRSERKNMKVSINYLGPIPAPIKEGQTVGWLRIEVPGIKTIEHPLEAGLNVPRLGLLGRLGAAIHHLIFGGLDS